MQHIHNISYIISSGELNNNMADMLILISFMYWSLIIAYNTSNFKIEIWAIKGQLALGENFNMM